MGFFETNISDEYLALLWFRSNSNLHKFQKILRNWKNKLAKKYSRQNFSTKIFRFFFLESPETYPKNLSSKSKQKNSLLRFLLYFLHTSQMIPRIFSCSSKKKWRKKMLSQGESREKNQGDSRKHKMKFYITKKLKEIGKLSLHKFQNIAHLLWQKENVATFGGVGSALGFNSRDPGSILGRDISRDILKNPGISRFDFSLIKMCISLIFPLNSHL